MFLDSHAHLTCDPVFKDLDGILMRAQKEGVDTIINVCTDKTTLKRGFDLAETYKWVYHIGATTPHDVEKEGDLNFYLFEKAAHEGKLVAIGETGLDYYYEHSSKILQQEFLYRYFALSLACNLPVVMHCRNAFADLFAFAEKYFSTGKGVLHCFTGTLEEAKKGIDKGWLISFSGIITFKKSIELRRIVKEIPLDHILIETDTPYLAPQSKRGKSNEPSFIREIAQTIANVKGIFLEEVAEVTRKNARELFQLAR